MSDRLLGLHVLVDDDPRWPRGPVEQCRAACEGGARCVQLRAKRATDSQALAWGREIRRVTADAGALFVMNDRFDLALLCDADAVHLGQEDLPPSRLPSPARAKLLVGRSTHDEAQVLAACAEEVDYVAFGPLFGTGSKDTGYVARGLPALQRIAALAAPRPVVAIGGIDAANAARVFEAGARGIAVISGIAGAADPVAATRELLRAVPSEDV